MEEARRPNELLRRARLLRGWSQQRVADHINAPNRQLVYRWETGKRSPGPFYRERLCQEFKMTAEELGLVELTIPDPADAAGTVAGDRAGGTADVVDSPLPESVNVLVRELWRDEVKRRAVLQMLSALAAGAALDGAPPQRHPIVPVAHASEVADHLARAFPELSTEDWLLGPHQVLGTVGGHLDLVQQLLPNLAGATDDLTRHEKRDQFSQASFPKELLVGGGVDGIILMAPIRIPLMVAVILIHPDLMSAVQGGIGALATALKDAFAGFVTGDKIACQAAFRRGVFGVRVIDIVTRAVREGIVG